YYFRPTQAHNGYLEVFLNLGWVGLCLLGGLLWASFSRLQQRVVLSADKLVTAERNDDLILADFSIAYLIAYTLYNLTEGTFQALNFLFVIFLFIVIECPQTQGRLMRSSSNSFPGDRRAECSHSHGAAAKAR